MEEKKLEQAPISQEEFEKKIHEVAEANRRKIEEDFYGKEPGKEILHLRDYSGVRKFKSIRRAIRKGYVSPFGEVYPKRPFKNIKSKKGSITYMKKRYYEQFTHKNRKVA
jgi:hypothetical protein